MITLQGIITNITYQNEDSGYAVVHLKTEAPENLFTCVGVMPTITAGESVVCQGEWETHPKFGKQFNVNSYEIVRPTTLEGIGMLLGSGLIANIGPARAKTILNAFGLQTLDILDNEPQRLMEVPGIGPKMFENIKGAWEKQRFIRRLMLFLQNFGVSVNMALKIYKVYGDQAQEKISENPYTLIEDVWGVGFKKADVIAQKMGFTHDSYKRIRAGLIYIMREAANEGHSYLPVKELVPRGMEILEVKEELVTYSLDHLVQINLLIREGDALFLPVYYHAEKKISENILSRISSRNSIEKNEQLDMWLAQYQKKNNWQADPVQEFAIKKAINSPVFLLTGGPGTGKTTVLQVIVSYFREKCKHVALAAPTGRAAQRMGSVAGLKAKTLHRLLEFRGGRNSFDRDNTNPVEADVIILDEVSMMDVLLMRSFLIAVKPSTQLIFVGDSNQLPSVGAGNVLADFIESKVVAHVHLTTIFRQAASSRIVTAAHEIITGIVPAFLNTKSDNCFFISQDEPEACVDLIVDLVTRRLVSRYNYNPIEDIQVLSPMHKGILGTQNLNTVLQKQLNVSGKGISRGQFTYFYGDKVMQIRNNYELGVFNGDIGKIIEIKDEHGLQVDFDGNRVDYDTRDLEELVPAYCISIHKSQGCEFKAVIIPLCTQHFIMLQRNLVYTALTRAKQLCIFVGSHKAMAIAVKNNQALLRYSQLAKRLKGKL
ncbi:MAG: ATP-dependent RecD-like DNA helicase [Fibrobacter sp.]|nr:ATP-dependent RecD-like DNA helicase [Fibrobacter sp.]